MLLAPLLLAAAPPVALELRRVVVALPSRDEATVTLHGGPGEPPPPARLRTQRVHLGDVTVPLAGYPVLTVDAQGSQIEFKVVLRQIGDGILTLDPYAVPVRWEGIDGKGKVAASMTGTIDLSNRGQIELPLDDLQRNYSQLVDYSASPSGMMVSVKALLAIYNPFSFEIAATRLAYRLDVAGEKVLDSERGGFRLRPGKSSDVLIEEDVPLADLAGALAGFLAHKPAVLSGRLDIRTPKGERGIPLLVQAGQ
jgi:hypothetical protein